LQRIDGASVYRLMEPLVYQSLMHRTYTVKAGFVTDGASIPRVFHSIVGVPIGGEYTEPAILHDALVRSGFYSPRFCDDLMKEAMEAHGTPQPTINSVMLGLRISRLWRRKRPVDLKADEYLSVETTQ
jgi:hypothetical protein